MNAEDDRQPSAERGGDQPGPDRPQQSQVDIERLAQKVYELMVADVRLARSRHEH